MMIWTLALTALQLAEAVQATSTPVGCRAVHGDTSWPSQEIWFQELPGVVATRARPSNASKTDFTYIARNASDVQAAVNFATKHNVRLTITNSGTDFLGRYVSTSHFNERHWLIWSRSDASNGLWLSVGNLKGVRVLREFSPSRSSAPSVNFSADPVSSANVIEALENQQAYVNFGAGVSGQELNEALHKSGLFTMGAAYGMISPYQYQTVFFNIVQVLSGSLEGMVSEGDMGT
jgi:hypothetical protein